MSNIRITNDIIASTNDVLKNLMKTKTKEVKYESNYEFGTRDLTKNVNYNNSCIMNQNILSSEDLTFKGYQCFTCPGKLENICEWCYYNCHQNHNANIKGVEQSTKDLSISKNICDCALGNHMFTLNVESRKSSEFNQSNCCPLNDVISSLDPKYYLFDKTSNKYLCIFCKTFCLDEEKENLNSSVSIPNLLENLNIDENMIVIKSSKLISHPKCQCSVVENHSSLSDNIMNLIALCDIDECSLYFNKFKLANQIISSNNYLLDNFLKTFSQVLKEKEDSENFLKFQTNKLFDSEILLIKLLEDTNNSYYNLNYNTLANLINFNFLSNSLKVHIEESVDSLKSRLILLRIYRNFTILPLVNKYSDYLGIRENSNFFIRTLLIDTHDFFITINLNKTLILKFLSDICKFIRKNSNIMENSLILNYIKEVLNYLELVIDLFYFDINSLEKLIEDLIACLYFIRENSSYIDLIQLIENISSKLIIYRYDYVIRSKSNLNQSDIEYKNCTLIESNLRNLSFKVNLNFYSNTSELKHVFLKGDIFTEKILKMCFYYCPIDLKNEFNYLNSNFIIDTLVSEENDTYLLSLSSLSSKFLANSDSLELNEEFIGSIFNIENKNIFDLLVTKSDENAKKIEKEKKLLNPGFNLIYPYLKLVSKINNENNFSYEINNIIESNEDVIVEKSNKLFHKEHNFKFGENENIIRLLENKHIFDFDSIFGKSTTEFLISKISNFDHIIEKYLKSQSITEFKFIKQMSINIELILDKLKQEFNIINNHEKNSDNLPENNFNITSVNKKYFDSLSTAQRLFLFQLSCFKIGIFNKIFDLIDLINKTPYITNFTYFEEKMSNVQSGNEVKEYKQNYNNLINLIFKVLDYISENNSFLSSLFFNQLFISNLFKFDFLKVCEFYNKKFETLKITEFKIDTSFFLKEMINIINMNNFNKISNLSIIFDLFNIAIICSHETQKRKNYEIIYNVCIEIFTNIAFDDNIKVYIDSLKLKSNLTNLNKKDLIDLQLTSTEKDIISFYRLINMFPEDYFIKLNKFVNIEEIRCILLYQYYLHPELIIQLISVYSKFMFENNYYLSEFLDKNTLIDFSNDFSINLTSNIYDIKKATDINYLISKSKIDNKELNYITLNNGFNTIIENFQNFSSYIKRYIFIFGSEPDTLLRYFSNTILKPNITALYKMINFTKKINADVKYTIYKFVFYFVNNCKILFENLKVEDLKFLCSEELLLLSCFNANNYKSMKEVKDEILESLKYHNDNLNSNLNNNLNTTYLFDTYFKYMKLFSSYREISNSYLYKFDFDENNVESKENENQSLFIDKKESSNVIGFSSSKKGKSPLNEELLVKDKKNSIFDIFNGSKSKSNNEIFYEEKLDTINGIYNKNDESTWFSKLITSEVEYIKELKAQYFENNILDDVFNNNTFEFENIKKIIILDIFNKIKISDSQINSMSEENFHTLGIINKLFKSEPHIWQNVICLISNARNYINHIIQFKLMYIFQLIAFNYNNISFNCETYTVYQLYLRMIEFLRLTCEDHNKIYQTLFVNINILENFSLLSFLFLSSSMIKNIISKKMIKNDINKYFRNFSKDNSYFDSLLEKNTDFLIEIIQGSISFNFDKIAKNIEFSNYLKDIVSIYDGNNEEYEFQILQFFRFITCYFEENSNSEKNKSKVLKNFNSNKLLKIMMHNYKKLNFLLCNDKSKEENIDSINLKAIKRFYNINEEKFNDSEFLIYNVNKDSHKDMIKTYITNEEFRNNPLFKINTNIFIILKKSFDWKESNNCSLLLKSLKALSDSVQEDKLNNQLILKLENYRFLNEIIKEVEINFSIDDSFEETYLRMHQPLFTDYLKYYFQILLENSKNKKNVLDKVVFLAHPDTLFVEKDDENNFTDIAPYEVFNEKLNFLIHSIDEYHNSLKIRKILWGSDSWYLNKMYKIKYSNMEIISAFFSIIVNIMMLFSIQYVDLKKNIIEYPFNKPIQQVAGIHLIFLFFIIMNWYSFQVYSRLKFDTTNRGIWEKLKFLILILSNSEIVPFIWNFLFGCLGLISENLQFLFSLQLFSIFNIVPTMTSVLITIRIRYNQFASTAYMLLILVFIYTAITYYNFRTILKDENDVSFHYLRNIIVNLLLAALFI